MEFFSGVTSWIMGGLRRQKGTQYSTPMAYTEDSAATVTYDSAMQLSAVWACVKLLSETVASLPLNIYKTTENGRKKAENHALTMLFESKPNRYQTRVEFFETLILNLVINGNAYCHIQRVGDRIVGLLPLMSSQMTVNLLEGGELTYAYSDGSNVTVFAESSIWHMKLMGNGTIGMSPLAYQRNSLGIAQAAETAVTKIYRNGAKPSGVITIDRVLTPAQREQVRTSFANLTSSTDDRLMVLEGGMKFDAVSLSPQDIELLSSRKFQISEVCRWYGVPSVLVNDANGTSVWGSGIESIMEGFYKLTLRPLLEKIEASIEANLIKDRKYEVEFDFDALLRSNIKSRYESYRVGITSGLMTPNEARAKENMPAIDGGEQLLIQGAMMPIDQLGVQQTQQDAPVVNVDTTGIQDSIKSIKELLLVTSKPQAEYKFKETPAPVINVTLPEMKHNNVFNLSQPNIEIVTPEPIVNVEAVMPEHKQVPPIVNVTNEVSPATVTVVDNHPKRAVQTVERKGDEIVKTVITYEK